MCGNQCFGPHWPSIPRTPSADGAPQSPHMCLANADGDPQLRGHSRWLSRLPHNWLVTPDGDRQTPHTIGPWLPMAIGNPRTLFPDIFHPRKENAAKHGPLRCRWCRSTPDGGRQSPHTIAPWLPMVIEDPRTPSPNRPVTPAQTPWPCRWSSRIPAHHGPWFPMVVEDPRTPWPLGARWLSSNAPKCWVTPAHQVPGQCRWWPATPHAIAMLVTMFLYKCV